MYLRLDDDSRHDHARGRVVAEELHLLLLLYLSFVLSRWHHEPIGTRLADEDRRVGCVRVNGEHNGVIMESTYEMASAYGDL